MTDPYDKILTKFGVVYDGFMTRTEGLVITFSKQ